ncbi:MAG: hypothetical protein AAF682_10835 [Planctomycetota bacterium]
MKAQPTTLFRAPTAPAAKTTRAAATSSSGTKVPVWAMASNGRTIFTAEHSALVEAYTLWHPGQPIPAALPAALHWTVWQAPTGDATTALYRYRFGATGDTYRLSTDASLPSPWVLAETVGYVDANGVSNENEDLQGLYEHADGHVYSYQASSQPIAGWTQIAQVMPVYKVGIAVEAGPSGPRIELTPTVLNVPQVGDDKGSFAVGGGAGNVIQFINNARDDYDIDSLTISQGTTTVLQLSAGDVGGPQAGPFRNWWCSNVTFVLRDNSIDEETYSYSLTLTNKQTGHTISIDPKVINKGTAGH